MLGRVDAAERPPSFAKGERVAADDGETGCDGGGQVPSLKW